jgi:hypothetical protein
VVADEEIFKNQPIRNRNGLWWPCLLMGQGYILFAKSCFRFLGKSETCFMRNKNVVIHFK